MCRRVMGSTATERAVSSYDVGRPASEASPGRATASPGEDLSERG